MLLLLHLKPILPNQICVNGRAVWIYTRVDDVSPRPPSASLHPPTPIIPLRRGPLHRWYLLLRGGGGGDTSVDVSSVVSTVVCEPSERTHLSSHLPSSSSQAPCDLSPSTESGYLGHYNKYIDFLENKHYWSIKSSPLFLLCDFCWSGIVRRWSERERDDHNHVRGTPKGKLIV